MLILNSNRNFVEINVRVIESGPKSLWWEKTSFIVQADDDFRRKHCISLKNRGSSMTTRKAILAYVDSVFQSIVILNVVDKVGVF